MASINRPFAFNPGGNITGTTQVGDLTIGTPTAGFAAHPSIKFWNGPFENDRIIVCYPDPDGNHFGASLGGPETGEAAFIGFRAFADEAALIEWTTFTLEVAPTTADQAYDLLLAAGFWTSYVKGSAAAAGTLFLASAPNGHLHVAENCYSGLIPTDIQYWHSGEVAYPNDNMTMWQDSEMTTPAVNGWYLFNDTSYAQVIDGTISNAQLCVA
tara:strand:- start:1104 stop:1742 length:639 start_codon:yes stop_codon:yes gene_type:complete